MLGYDFEIIYKKGKQNVVADALSRKDEDVEAGAGWKSTWLTLALPLRFTGYLTTWRSPVTRGTISGAGREAGNSSFGTG